MATHNEHTSTFINDEGEQRVRPRSALLTGVLLGIGIIGFLDETIFHQLLQWHAFYWNTDQFGRTLSDGLFHVFSDLVLLGGAFRLWRTHLPWTAFTRNLILASMLIGAGGFNLYDGVIQHAILHLHLVNEHVCNAVSSQDTILGICRNDVPYELAWDILGAALLIVGIIWWRRLSRRVSAPTTRG